MKTSKSKTEWKQITDVRDPAFGHATHEHEYTGERPNGFHHVWVDPQNERWLAKSETDIISLMEANQARFGNHEKFPSLLQSAENERRLQLNDRPSDRAFDGEDVEAWQRRSEEQGAE